MNLKNWLRKITNKKMEESQLLFDRKDYDPMMYVGVCAEDCKMISLALSQKRTLRIDSEGHIYDNTGRYIADGKERG